MISNITTFLKYFVKEPLKTLLFILLIVIGFMYMEEKKERELRETQCLEKQNKLEVKVDELTNQLRRSDSTVAGITAKLKTLKELGKIK